MGKNNYANYSYILGPRTQITANIIDRKRKHMTTLDSVARCCRVNVYVIFVFFPSYNDNAEFMTD